MGALAYCANATFLPLLFGKKIKECLVAVVCSLKFTLLLKLVLSLFSSHSYSSSLCRAVFLSVVFFFSVVLFSSQSHVHPPRPTFFLSVLLFPSRSYYFPLCRAFSPYYIRTFFLSVVILSSQPHFFLSVLLFSSQSLSSFPPYFFSSESYFYPLSRTFILPVLLFSSRSLRCLLCCSFDHLT